MLQQIFKVFSGISDSAAQGIECFLKSNYLKYNKLKLIY
jgi:hypothetical protein